MTESAVRRSWLCLLLLLLAASGACRSTPTRPTADAQARVDHILAGAHDRQGISARVGANASCVPATSTTVLCEWLLGSRQPGWSPLAEAIDTSARVGLLCELPADGSPRAPGSCSAHPRLSSRNLWAPPQTARGRTGQQIATRIASQEGEREDQIRRATELIAGARTLLELSRLMGALPECWVQDDETQRCLWHLSNATYGHGIVATWIDAPLSKRVRLDCELPRDGSARADGTCQAQIEA